MPLIYCETERTGEAEFQFIQTWYVGAGSMKDALIDWKLEENDRLRAAIINVGFACRDLSELDTEIKVVGIASDKDGKDFKHGGEHDILFNLLAPPDDFAARKARSLYYEYERYLGRIKQLCLRHSINIVLQDEAGRVKYGNT